MRKIPYLLGCIQKVVILKNYLVLTLDFRVCRYMADISLYCYVLGTHISSAILVDIGEMTRVEGVDVPIGKFSIGHLKKKICPNNNEANSLRLWKFETPFKKDNEELKTFNENGTDLLGEDLSPGELIRTIFPVGYVFSPNHIHIIVEPPKPSTNGKCLLMVCQSNKDIFFVGLSLRSTTTGGFQVF